MGDDGKVATEPQGKLKKYVSPSRVSKLRQRPVSRSERVCMFARRRDLGEHDVVAPGGRIVETRSKSLALAPTSSWFKDSRSCFKVRTKRRTAERPVRSLNLDHEKECGPGSLDEGPCLKQNKWNRLSWSFPRSQPNCDTLMNPRAGATRP